MGLSLRLNEEYFQVVYQPLLSFGCSRPVERNSSERNEEKIGQTNGVYKV
jgi:hypothetical protein